MRTPRLRAALATLAILAGSLTLPLTAAHAWWGPGHMVVALLAYRQMKPETRTKVDALLKTHPDYAKWTAEVPADAAPDVRGAYIFAIASTWPDRIKAANDATVTIKFYNPNDTRRAVPNPPPSDPAHYPDLDMHQTWHYVDVPIDADGRDRELPTGATALTQIPVCRDGIAAAGLPASYRAYYLAWLEHLVGDIHQPLHACERYSPAFPNGDQGGNAVKIKADVPRAPNNLHSYWDSLLGGETDWKSVEATVAAVNADAPRQLAGIDPQTRDSLDANRWTRESFAIAQDMVYTVGPDDAGPLPQPDSIYHETAVRLAHQRAALAGHRLALLIDQALTRP